MNGEDKLSAAERLLNDVQSRSFGRRKAVAEKLLNIHLDAGDHPQAEPANLERLNEAIKKAADSATDAALFKQAYGISRLWPGFVPIVLCLAAQLAGVRLGAIPWALATIWLLFWYFKSLNQGFKLQTEPARTALKIGAEAGLFKGRPN